MSNLSRAFSVLDAKEAYCSYATLHRNLAPEDARALDGAIQKGTPSYVIAKVMRSEGYKVSHGSIQDHRDGTCKCPKGKE